MEKSRFRNDILIDKSALIIFWIALLWMAMPSALSLSGFIIRDEIVSIDKIPIGIKSKSLDRGDEEKVDVFLKRQDTQRYQPAVRFIVSPKGILYDSQTNLEWCGGKQHWSWYYADTWANELKDYGGGWRLPKLSELERICENDAGQRALRTIAGTRTVKVWSSNCRGLYQAWAYDYFQRHSLYLFKDYIRDCSGVAVRHRMVE